MNREECPRNPQQRALPQGMHEGQQHADDAVEDHDVAEEEQQAMQQAV